MHTTARKNMRMWIRIKEKVCRNILQLQETDDWKWLLMSKKEAEEAEEAEKKSTCVFGFSMHNENEQHIARWLSKTEVNDISVSNSACMLYICKRKDFSSKDSIISECLELENVCIYGIDNDASDTCMQEAQSWDSKTLEIVVTCEVKLLLSKFPISEESNISKSDNIREISKSNNSYNGK